MFRSQNDYELISDPTNQKLDVGDDIQCELTGYKKTAFRTCLHIFFTIIFLGIPYLLACCFFQFQTLKYKKCSLKTATIILVKDPYGNKEFISIQKEVGRIPNLGHVSFSYFYYRCSKYVWSTNSEEFKAFISFMPQLTVDEYLSNNDGLFYDDYVDLLKLCGYNQIEIKVKSYWQLFKEEVFNVFYIFQVFSCILWLVDNYFIYSACIIILTIFSIVVTLRQTRKQVLALRDLVETSKCYNVKTVRRNLLSENIEQDAKPQELVPGDLIVFPKSDYVLPCDIVLLTGQCIVNESMLTGESVPVTKTALSSSNEYYSPTTHKRSTLFSGTHMIQSRYYGGEQVLGRVISTGFNTAKGALIKSILYPTPVGIQLYKDSLKFVFALFLIAAAGTSYCLYLYIHRKASTVDVLVRSLDIITIVIPPALPAAMAVGVAYSQNRLKNLKIFCVSLPRINVCGKIKLACFDKTGTLTHDGLDMHSVLPSNGGIFAEPVTDSLVLPHYPVCMEAMAACHSLAHVNGKLAGDPLDLSMFQFTNWTLEEPNIDEHSRFDMLAPTIVFPEAKTNISKKGFEYLTYAIGIIRQFPFSSTLQSMSVICRQLGEEHMRVFTKGAPEKVALLCHPHTVPKDFFERLSKYTAKGFRVIALAEKTLPLSFKWKESQKVERYLIESDLNFVGLLIMQNSLKPETTPIIQTLHNANIRTVMITGDNILTAISVARDCQMVKTYQRINVLEIRNDNCDIFVQNLSFPHNSFDEIVINADFEDCHFAMDGKTWDKLKLHHLEILPQILVRTTIFARFQPDQKTQVIKALQELDYIVAMVGDGANDCGALKAAHVGISLSQAEASVAAPFTSAIENISCLKYLMLEGRCALITSFAVFKYMALYSLIQFITILILYKQHSILGDTQFLFIDLIVTTSLTVAICRQGPSEKLGVKRPLGSLVSGSNLIPLFLQIILCGAIQLLALFYLYQQKWFNPVPHTKHEEIVECWENTVLFLVSVFQYVIVAFVYCKGKPYRERLIHNFWFLVCGLSLLCFQAWLFIAPTKFVAEFFEILYLPRRTDQNQLNFKYKLLLFPLVHFFAAVFIEVGIADREWPKKLIHFIKRKKVPRNKYKQLLQDSTFTREILCNE